MKPRFLLVVFLAALSLAACGGGGTASAPTAATAPTAAPAAEAPTAAAAPTAAEAPTAAAAPTAAEAPTAAAAEQPTAAAAASGEPINIGGGFALTGDESALDLPAANGAKLAAKEINAAGGVLGRPIELVVHDTQYKMDLTAQVAKQFVEQDHVIGVIGFTDTDSVLAAGPTIQKAGLPFITAGATSPKIPTQVGNEMFLACFGDNVQAAAGAEYAFKNFGKNGYLLWDKGVEYTTLLGS